MKATAIQISLLSSLALTRKTPYHSFKILALAAVGAATAKEVLQAITEAMNCPPVIANTVKNHVDVIG